MGINTIAYQSTSAPTVTDHSVLLHRLGQVWLQTSTGLTWRCNGLTPGAAIWLPFSRVGYEAVATSTTLVDKGNKVEQQVEQTASVIITKFPAAPLISKIIVVMNYSGGNNTLDGNGKNINGSATVSILDQEVHKYIYNGTQWRLTS